MSEHDYVESGRKDLLVAPSRATPSEVTVQMMPQDPVVIRSALPEAQQPLRNLDDSIVKSVNDEETEFTEQMDNDSQHIGHEIEKSIERLNVDNDDEMEDETVFDGGSDRDGARSGDKSQARSRMKILNQGSVKIVYQDSSQRPESRFKTEIDSVNDRI